MKLYTVSDFAREKGISLSTVQRWIRIGKIHGLIKNDRSYLIPESNLSLEVEQGKKNKKKRVSIKTPVNAKEAYSNRTEDNRNRLKVTYEELQEIFDSDLTMESIALNLGVTKQLISQIYQQYFSFGINGHKRRSEIQFEKAKDKSLKETMDSERISYLEAALVSSGLSMRPIQVGKSPTFYSNMIEVNGHKCKIHLSRKDTKFAGQRYRSYSRFLVTRSYLDDYEFVIVITGEGEKRKIFIIPTEILKGQFRKMDHRKSFYLPTSEKGAYRNLKPLLDWWSYKEAWHLLL